MIDFCYQSLYQLFLGSRPKTTNDWSDHKLKGEVPTSFIILFVYFFHLFLVDFFLFPFSFMQFLYIGIMKNHKYHKFKGEVGSLFIFFIFFEFFICSFFLFIQFFFSYVKPQMTGSDHKLNIEREDQLGTDLPAIVLK